MLNFQSVLIHLYLIFAFYSLAYGKSSLTFDLSRIIRTTQTQQDLNSSNYVYNDEQNTRYLKQSISFKMQNHYNLQYYGTLLVGTQKQPLKFLFDTGSTYIWFPTNQCLNCSNITYYPKQSKHFLQTSNKPQTIEYIKGSATGYPCIEQIWFSPQDKIDAIRSLAVFNVSDAKKANFDGVLGLSNQPFSPPYILDVLLQNQLISKRVLSFLYKDGQNNSKFILGEPDMSLTNSSDQQHLSFNLLGLQDIFNFQNSCSLQLNVMRFNDQDIFNSQYQRPVNAKIDTGSSMILIPTYYYQKIRDILKYYYGQMMVELPGLNKITVPCDQIYKDEKVTFQIGDDSNIIDIGFNKLWMKFQDDDTEICLLMVSSSHDDGLWILGDAFIRDIYVAIDYDDNTVDMYGRFIIPQDQSSKKHQHLGNQYSIKYSYNQPYKKDDQTDSTTIVIIFVGTGIIALFVILMVLAYYEQMQVYVSYQQLKYRRSLKKSIRKMKQNKKLSSDSQEKNISQSKPEDKTNEWQQLETKSCVYDSEEGQVQTQS